MSILLAFLLGLIVGVVGTLVVGAILLYKSL